MSEKHKQTVLRSRAKFTILAPHTPNAKPYVTKPTNAEPDLIEKINVLQVQVYLLMQEKV